MTTWPEMSLPPINLYNAPARGKDAIVTDTSKMTFNELAECVTALEDELYDTKQKLEQAQARIAELTGQAAIQNELMQEMVYTESVAKRKEMADSATGAGDAWLLRKQAEAVEPAIRTALRNMGHANIYEDDIDEFAHSYAQSLRQREDFEERAVGEVGPMIYGSWDDNGGNFKNVALVDRSLPLGTKLYTRPQSVVPEGCKCSERPRSLEWRKRVSRWSAFLDTLKGAPISKKQRRAAAAIKSEVDRYLVYGAGRDQGDMAQGAE